MVRTSTLREIFVPSHIRNATYSKQVSNTLPFFHVRKQVFS